MSSSILSSLAASMIGRAPYVAMLIVALYFWLVHPRRWTRGMNLFGIGIIGHLVLTVISPVLSIFLSRAFALRGGFDQTWFILGQTMIHSLLAAVPLGFLLYGGFELAREREDEEFERDAERR